MSLLPITDRELAWADENLTAFRALALELHEGQVDIGRNPYYLHLQYVADQQTTCVGKILGYFHDSVEDGKIDFVTLRRYGIPEAIVQRIEILTRRKGQDYDRYVQRAGEDVYTRRVKIADLEHNLQLGRLRKWTEGLAERVRKYMFSLQYLRKLDRVLQESAT